MPLQRRIPKRGFTNPFKKIYATVNLDDLQRFSGLTEIRLENFKEAGFLKKSCDGIKLLASGEITSPLTIHVHKASAAAISKVEAAGGRIEIISPPKRK